MKVVAWLAGVGTLLSAAAYMVVSLNRWEWNRALFFGLIVLIAEVGLGFALVLRRLTRLEHASRVDPTVRDIVRATRPPSPERFAWLQDHVTARLSVFITFLVGGGVLIAGIAWMVDRVARATSTPLGEDRLAARLSTIRYPIGGLLVDDVTALAQDVPGADDVQLRKLLRRAA